MARNSIYDDDTKQDISDDDLRNITGINQGQEDQIDTAAAQEEARRRRSQRIAHGLDIGLGAGEHGVFGERAKAGSHLARQELKKAEQSGFDFNKLGDKGWYKDELPKVALNRATEGARKGFYHFFVKKHKAALLITTVPLIVTAIVMVTIFLLAPFKHDHFETILRSVNFARFQLLVRSQFTRVIFEASVLTDNSVGTFRNSPLVRQIRQAVPDRQLAQLGESGKIQWEFKPNGSFGNDLLPLRETLQAVVIEGDDGKKHRYDIDEFANREFGKNYADLPLDQKWKVQGSFVNATSAQLGDLMKLMPRHVRWNPATQVFQRAGVFLVRVMHRGEDYKGTTDKEARVKNAENTVSRVMEPSAPSVKPGIPDLQDDVNDTRKGFVDDAIAGNPTPGQVRSKIASRARFARGASDVVFATTAYCIGREMIKIFSPEYQADRESQAIRSAAFDMSGTDQDKAHAMQGQARYAMNQKWDGTSEIPDASQSVVYKRITNQPVPDHPNYDQQIPWLNPAMALGDWYPAFEQYNKIAAPLIMEGGLIPGILKLMGIDLGFGDAWDGICTAVMNEYVQYGVAGVELIVAVLTLGTVKGVTAAVKAGLHLVFHLAVGVGLDKLLSLLIEWTIKEFAGLYFTGLAQGANRVNEDYVAMNSIAQTSTRNVTYGRILDQNETNGAQAEATLVMKQEFEQGSTIRRYFALDNPFSLASITIAKLPSSPSGFAASIQSTFKFMGSMLTYPFRLLGSLGTTFSPHNQASAAGIASKETTFGVEQWGWSLEEQQRVQNDPTFALPALVARVEPQLTRLNERYAKCYNYNNYRLQIEKPSECTRDLLSEEDALYWRYYNALMFSAVHLTGSV